MGGRSRVLLGLFATSLVWGCGGNAPRTSVPAPIADTTLGNGDVFDVSVYDEEELSGSYRVDDNGSIDFPLIGRVQVDGLEPSDVASLLAQLLRDGEFLRDPHVSVFVQEYNSKRVAVLGAVQRPGNLSFAPGMTVVQAISQAGGFTPLASKNKVTLSRRVEGTLRRFEVRADDVTRGESEDPRVQPGDIIFVPERVF